MLVIYMNKVYSNKLSIQKDFDRKKEAPLAPKSLELEHVKSRFTINGKVLKNWKKGKSKQKLFFISSSNLNSGRQ